MKSQQAHKLSIEAGLRRYHNRLPMTVLYQLRFLVTHSVQSLVVGIVVFWMSILPSLGQYTDLTPGLMDTSLVMGLTEVQMVWGDLNNDGRGDLFATGMAEDSTFLSYIFFADQSGKLIPDTTLSKSLVGLTKAYVSLTDINNDGIAEIFYMGEDSVQNFRAILFGINNNQIVFNNVALQNMIPLAMSNGDWEDYDNDGDLDFILTGLTESGSYLTRLYQNNEGVLQNMESVSSLLVQIAFGAVRWSDLNGDGFWDIIISGNLESGSPVTEVYLNDGNNEWQTVGNDELPDLGNSQLDVIDYNNDGLEDLVISGRSADSSIVNGIYQNNGSGIFSIISTIEGLFYQKLYWGDITEDGWADLIAWGRKDSISILKVLIQNAAQPGTFIDSTTLDTVERGGVVLADMSNNGTLDIILSGTLDSAFWRVLQNINPDASGPVAPANLSFVLEQNKAVFSWDAIPGVDYRLYLKDVSTNTYLYSTLADTLTGKRKALTYYSNLHQGQWTFNNIEEGTYTFGVQAVDRSREGSSFSKQTFRIDAPKFEDQTDRYVPPDLTGVRNVALSHVDVDLDGDLDLILMGENTEGIVTLILLKDEFGNNAYSFSDISLTALTRGDMAWEDYDLDGDPDLVISGWDGINRRTILYQNNSGSGTFNAQSTSFAALDSSQIEWGDYDSDGDADLLCTGFNGTQWISHLYRNDGGGIFSEIPSLATLLGDFSHHSTSWIDYDLDGDLDLWVSGQVQGSLVSRIVDNNRGVFSFKETENLQGVKNGKIEIADFNRDSHPDILLLGTETLLYKNQEGNSFALGSTPFPELYRPSASWGDYDNDGDHDLILTGSTNEADTLRSTLLFINQGNEVFEEDEISSSQFNQVGGGSNASWIDVNDDRLLDLFLIGSEGGEFQVKLYANQLETTPTDPIAPINLNSNLLPDGRVRLTWETNELNSGNTYNLSLSTDSQLANKKSSLSELSTGKRRIIAPGNVQHTQSWIWEKPVPGNYFWSVQSIDADFEGSSFAPLQAFTIQNPEFSDITPTGLTGLSNAAASWGDIDCDGDLDLAVLGGDGNRAVTQIFKQEPKGNFVLSGINIPQMSDGAMDWGDYNKDGYIDLIITGIGSPVGGTLIYKNDANGNLTAINDNVLDVFRSSVDWGDYDMDGDLDILLSGFASGRSWTKIYRYDGNDVFVDIGAELDTISAGSAVWGDYDKDGDLDVLLSGNGVGSIFENKDNVFEKRVFLRNMINSKAVWVDYNNDGFLDVILTGLESENGGEPVTVIYNNVEKNDGSRSFQQVITLPGVENGSLSYGDYTGEGRVDLLLSGKQGEQGFTTQLYKQIGQRFILDSVNSAFLPNIGNSSVSSFADVDGDGKLDVLLIGQTDEGERVFGIYKNELTENTFVLTPPQNPQSIQNNDEILLTWNPPANGNPGRYTYDLYIGTASKDVSLQDAISLMSPDADLNTGVKKVLRLGKLTESSYTLTDLPDGTYYWGVQAVDKDFESSIFSPEQSFEFRTPNFESDSTFSFTDDPPALNLASFAWVDYDTDGDIDLHFAGQDDEGNPQSYLYTNQNGRFSIQNTGLPGFFSGDISWTDFDHDGDPDVLITGNSNTGLLTNLYRNDEGSFTLVNTFTGLSESSAAWGDIDSDGDKDLILTGKDNTGTAVTKLYRNENLTEFTEIAHNLKNVYSGDVKWGDLDNDGDLDLLLSGLDNADNPVTLIYINTLGLFEQLDPGFEQIAHSSMDWGDYNNDGLLDIIISGKRNPTFTKIYKNLDGNSFQDIAVNLEPVSEGVVMWGDYNNDGFRDILVSGTKEDGNGFSKIYQNNQGLGFTADENSSVLLPQVGAGSAGGWADVDNDGKLDVFVMGKNTQTGTNQLLLLKNNLNVGSSILLPAPENLIAGQTGERLIFSWDPPSEYNPELVDGLTYSISLSPVNTGTAPVYPDSDPVTGILFVPQNGNVYHATSVEINGLTTGEYEFRVQAVSPSLTGSAFSNPVTVSFFAPEIVNATGTAFTSPLNGIDNAEAEWADYDGNGDLDLVIQGLTEENNSLTELYRNENGILVKDEENSNRLEQVDGGSFAWGDYDNDGDIDLLLCGLSTNGSVTQLYNNNGGIFTQVNIALTGVFNSSLKWVDIDQDGWMDISLIGNDGVNKISKIYLNKFRSNPTEPFIETGGLNVSIDNGSQAWADVDKDGDWDVLLIGAVNGTTPWVSLRLNDGSGVFTPVEGTGITALRQASAVWGEYDNDGWPDVLVSGISENGTPRTLVYRNNQNNTFTAINVANVGGEDAFWGDWDEDGDWDITVVGDTSGGVNFAGIYINEEGTYTFKQEDSNVLENVDNGAFLRWGDYDGNGYPDILLGGRELSGEKTLILYQNTSLNNNPKDRVPPPPANLTATQQGNRLVFSWESPSSDNYPAAQLNALSYNFYVGLQNGVPSIQSPNADLTTGKRWIIGRGNASQTKSWLLEDLPDATYSWGVQSIDADYEGSEFVRGNDVVFSSSDWADATEAILPSEISGISEAELHAVDYDANGEMDLLILGTRNALPFTNLYRNQNGQFQIVTSSLPPVSNAAFDWGDYNNDGFVDLLLTGNINGTAATRIYINNSGVDFSNTGVGLDGVQGGDAKWIDYDNDGDLDIIYMGVSDTGPITRLYQNQGGAFTNINFPFPGLSNGSIAVADYNKDGYIDIFITGSDGVGAVSRLYKNVSGTGFEVQTFGFQNLQNSHANWVDYDNDGDQDLFITGLSGSNYLSRLYRNDLESNGFTSLPLNIPAVNGGSVVWGDVNFDGFRDVIVSGEGASEDLIQIFMNEGGAGFVLDSIGSGVFEGGGAESSVAFGDFDLNGVLDAAIAGTTPTANGLRIITNQRSALNKVEPGTPGNLNAEQMGRSVVLKWNTPQNDNNGISSGYTYNFFIGTSQDAVDIRSPHAILETGKRMIISDGAIGNNTQYQLNELESGTYFWSVQTIGQDFEASEFAGIDSFEYVNPVLLDSTQRVFSGLPEGIRDAAVAWGDYNNDNLLDLIVCGETSSGRITRLYKSTGSGLVNSGITTFANVSQGSLEWGDFNLDGNLDLLLTGMSNSGPISYIYINNGNESFTLENTLLGISEGEATWGDLDNDGDPDIVISGLGEDGNPLTQLYINNGNDNNGDQFVEQSSDLANVRGSALEWQDYNNDGYLDLILSGTNTSGFPITRIYRNNTLGSLVIAEEMVLTNLSNGDISWGDYNNDGFADVLLAGTTGAGPVVKVFRNNEGISFEEIFSVDGGQDGAVAWGDYNNDGLRDFVVAGIQSGQTGERVTRVYKNAGNNNFILDQEAGVSLPEISNGDLAWADYDKDGFLDLVVAGNTGDNTGTINIFHNEINTIPLQPSAPVQLRANQSGQDVILEWGSPVGPSAQIAGYTYNIFVRQGDNLIVSPVSDITNGFLRKAANGNVYYTKRWVLTGLAEGTYSWGVQSIDASYRGSSFATGADFSVTSPTFNEISSEVFTVEPEYTEATLTWGDYDGDQRQDLVISGLISDLPATRLYRNVNAGGPTLNLIENTIFENVAEGDLSWGDYDNDEDLDLALTGRNEEGPFSAIYRNNGNGNFNLLVLDLIQVSNSSLAWGDMDNDGDLDLALSGLTQNNTEVVRIYQNNRNDNFTLLPTNIPGVQKGSIAWGDYDNDQDLDLLITGENLGTSVSMIWINDGEAGFSEAPVVVDGFQQLPGVKDGSGSWGDFNNDGWLDVLLSGNTGTTGISRVYLNNSDGTFSQIANLTGLINGEAEWGDVNNDNLLDIINVGILQSGPGIRIYANQGDGTFELDTLNSNTLIPVLGASGVALTDLEKNRKLDIAIAGRRAVTNEGTLKIYRNSNPANPVNIPAPEGLSSTQENNVQSLSWQMPSVIPSEIANGLSYNLYIGRSTKGVEFQSPMATLDDGYRQVTRIGPINGTNWKVKGLSAGSYFWSVQAIDQHFEGSQFAQEQNFLYTPPDFIDVSATAFSEIPQGLTDADLSWVDFNNDDQIDLFVSGSGRTQNISTLYRNDNGVLSPSSVSMLSVNQGDAAWGDLDNDNRIDLALIGVSDTGFVTNIYRNISSEFVLLQAFPGVSNGSVEWGDYNNDGRIDLLVTGQTGGGSPLTALYRNIPGQNLSLVFTELEDVAQGRAKWGDLDKDGWLDIAMTGVSDTGVVTYIYRNNRIGGFELVNKVLPGVQDGIIDLLDVNNDGFLDVLIAGSSGGTPITHIYLNQRNLQFELFDQLEGIFDGSAAWGDFNDDGFPDIILSGTGTEGPVTSLFRNMQGTAFVKDSLNSAAIQDVSNGSSIAWADYNNDKKLDLVLAGEDQEGTGKNLILYNNVETNGNRKAGPPRNLRAFPEGKTLRFAWSPPTGYIPGLEEGLSYNIYIRSNTSLPNIDAPESNRSNGFRRIIKLGSIEDTTWTITNLSTGTYFWSVQAIDPDFEGSSFAEEVSVEFILPVFEEVETVQDSLIGIDQAATSWGDFDNDGDMDLLATGRSVNANTAWVYRNLGNDTFEKVDFFLPKVRNGDVEWVDYNRDGFLDIIICGETSRGLITSIYRSDSAKQFIDIGAKLPGLKDADIDWGDFDSDGDIDLALCGISTVDGNSVPLSRVFINLGGSNFTRLDLSLPAISNGMIQWIDVDSDGFLDLFLSGNTASDRVSYLYRNKGNRSFERLTTPFIPLGNSAGDWGDFNNDGNPDLLISGERSDGTYVSYLYRNNGGTSFTGIDSLIGVANGTIHWGDYNEDGFIDVLISGDSQTPLLNSSPNGTGVTAIYENTGGQELTLDSVNSAILTQVRGRGHAGWVDYNNDGKLDLFIAGSNSETDTVKYFKVVKNIRSGLSDTRPLPPTLNGEELGEDRVTFSWNPPGGAAVGGYTYNLRIVDSASMKDIVIPMSDLQTGRRKIVENGNVGSVNQWTLLDLPSGAYYWTVQSVDQEYEASEFAPVDSFNFLAARFIDVSGVALEDSVLGFNNGDMDFGDFDNDDDLDLIITGVTDSGYVTALYENVGQSRFVEVDIDMVDVGEGSVVWGDINNDGWLDAVVVGRPEGGETDLFLYINVEGDDDERTLESVPINLPGVVDGDIELADYNNDGYLDLLVIGFSDNFGAISRVYTNNRNGNFGGDLQPLVGGLAGADAAWGDFDGDGDLDLAITGRADIDKKIVIVENRFNEVSEQEFKFREISATRDFFVQVSDGSIQWGDYDNDGDLDLLICGEGLRGDLHTRIYQNLGEGNFSEVDFNLPGITDGAAMWGDYDEDGILDILISGRNGPNENDRITQLYFYNTFTSSYTPDLAASSVLENVNELSISKFADYDRNGLLDIFVAGRSSGPDTTRIFKIYQNKIGVLPRDLQPPIDLTVTDVRSGPDNTFELDLSWTPSDSSVITQGYSYNFVFTNSGSNRFSVTPQSDTVDGFRKIVNLGNVSQNETWTIRDLPEGAYRWTVQSIDQSYQGSDFASWVPLTLEIPSYEDVTPDIFNGEPVGLANGSISIGDVDNDEDLDFVITGNDQNGRAHSNLYIYSRTNSKYQVSPFSNRIMGVTRSGSDWSDFDGDGDLDLLVSGADTLGLPSTRIYRNVGSGNFVLDTIASNSLPQLVDASVAWGDYNNDGFDDILLIGNIPALGKVTAIYRNDGDGAFSRLRNALGPNSNDDFEALDRGSIAWGDFDKDGHLDFIISGRDEQGDPFTAVYRNNFLEDEVDNRFSIIRLTNGDVFDSSVAWGDVNNDGYLDIVLSGFGGQTIDLITAIYVYNPLQDRFDPQTLPISRVQKGQVFFGDYNFDGYRDILICGQTEDTTLEAQIIPNSRGVGFGQDPRSSSKLVGVTMSNGVWADLGEPDGKLDIIMSGIEESGNHILKIYRNERNGNVPEPPVASNLSSENAGLFVRLSWDPPEEFDSTLVNGLTYNLIVIRQIDTALQVSPMSDTIRGVRRIVKMGNAGHHTVWNLTQIPTGNYKWGIQVVDAHYEGGEFVFADDEFLFQAPLPRIVDSSFAEYFPWGGDVAESWIEVEDTFFVREVRAFYSPISSLEENFVILEREGNRYTFPIRDNLPLMDPEGRMIGIDYFFEVRGRFATNEVRTGKKYTYIRFPEGTEDMNLTDNTLIRYGIDRSFYNILSVPLELNNTGIQQVLDELGPYDVKKWRMFHTMNDQYVEYRESGSPFTDFEVGKGYWLIIGSTDGTNDVFPGEGTTVKVTENNPYVLRLTPGWNQIGNPYNFNISWDDIIDDDLNPGSSTELEELRTFKFALNNDANVIERFSGGIVMAHSDITLKIPVFKNQTAQRLAASNTVTQSQDILNPLHYATWRVKLNVESGGLRSNASMLGMDRNARMSRDPLDRMRMPRFDDPGFTYLDVSFEHPEYFYPHFSKDIVPTKDSHIWDFIVSSNVGKENIRLSWDNSYFGNSNKQLILFDEERQWAVDMRRDTAYISSSSKINRPFRVYYGDPAFIDSVLIPDRIVLGDPYPNPFNDRVVLPFTLVENGLQTPYKVNFKVYNLIGQEVFHTDELEFAPGFQEIIWEGKDRGGETAKPGTYIYMLQVWDGEQWYQETGRMVKY